MIPPTTHYQIHRLSDNEVVFKGNKKEAKKTLAKLGTGYKILIH